TLFRSCLLIFYLSLLKYTYHYNYRSHISLQVAKLAKSAGVQILISPTVSTDLCFKFNFCMIRMTLTMSCSNRGDSRGEAATSCASSQIVQSLTHWVERMTFAFSLFVITEIFVDIVIICRLYPLNRIGR